jgi:hypothetical protein
MFKGDGAADETDKVNITSIKRVIVYPDGTEKPLTDGR